MPKFGNCAADAVRTGCPPSVSDRQIRAEIARRLSGAPEELTPFRIQRALEHAHNSIPRLDRIPSVPMMMRHLPPGSLSLRA